MTDRPNVLVVVADQLRRSALSHAGDPNVSTPEIDGLAAAGTRFDSACSTYPACVPARATFMTGRPAHALAGYGHDYRLSPRERALGDAFRDGEYWTGYAGKWHLHGGAEALEQDRRWTSRMPIPPGYRGGFEHWRGFELRNDPYDTVYFVDDDPDPRSMDGHQTDQLTDIGIDLIADATADDRPFFLTLSYEAPHPPHVAPPTYHEPWADVELTLPPDVQAAVDRGDTPGPIFGPEGARSYASVGNPAGSGTLGETTPTYHRDVFLDDVRGYYAMIEHLDANIGRLLDALEERGLREETVVVFTSDHGEQLGRHDRMKKRCPYEPSVGVPFIVAGPGVEGGSVHSDPIHTEDWYPTLLGLAGLDIEADLPGRDLGPLLCGATDRLDRPGVGLEHVESRGDEPPWRAFRTERFKYTVREGEPSELFDLETDPLELKNLIYDSEHRKTAARLHGHLRSNLASSVDTYPLEPAFGYDGLHDFDSDRT